MHAYFISYLFKYEKEEKTLSSHCYMNRSLFMLIKMDPKKAKKYFFFGWSFSRPKWYDAKYQFSKTLTRESYTCDMAR